MGKPSRQGRGTVEIRVDRVEDGLRFAFNLVRGNGPE